jgi:hypothetical protein
MLLASIAYAGALATPPGQHALADLNLQGFLKAHVYACLRSERHGHIIEEAEEKALFGWLLAQVELGLTDDLLKRMLSQRLRRQERTAAT